MKVEWKTRGETGLLEGVQIVKEDPCMLTSLLYNDFYCIEK